MLIFYFIEMNSGDNVERKFGQMNLGRLPNRFRTLAKTNLQAYPTLYASAQDVLTTFTGGQTSSFTGYNLWDSPDKPGDRRLRFETFGELKFDPETWDIEISCNNLNPNKPNDVVIDIQGAIEGASEYIDQETAKSIIWKLLSDLDTVQKAFMLDQSTYRVSGIGEFITFDDKDNEVVQFILTVLPLEL